MSIFDISPAVACLRAMDVADAKDRRNARRIPTPEAPATAGIAIRAGQKVGRLWLAVRDAVTDLHAVATSRSSSL